MNRFRVMVILFSLSVMLGGCAHLLRDPGSEEALRQRVTQAWSAKVNNNWDVVYDLSVAEYRKKVTRQAFLRGANLDVSEFSIKEIAILESGKEAVATVACKATHMGMTFPFVFKDTWLLEDDGWRLKLVPLGIPGM
ncbi:MAG: hypothetical protein JXI32_05870 [Deltaproteobacteria bacterium]|nr:hypothetical protein [Deltaproteobacteria bacterium]